MALGQLLGMGGPDMTQPAQMNTALAQALSSQNMMRQAQPQGQGGLGGILAGLQRNPAAIQALLNTGARLLAPQSFGSSGGRIASAAAQGLQDYTSITTESEERRRQRELQDREMGQRDRQLDQADERIDLQEGELGLRERTLEIEADQWKSEFGLSEDKLEAQKRLWDAQIDRYAADAQRLRTAAEEGNLENLTGPERIINRMATIFRQNNVPEDRAYMAAFDVYNRSQMDEAKAIAAVTENMGFLADTDKGREALDRMVNQVREAFRTSEDILNEIQQEQGSPAPAEADPAAAPQEVAPGVTQEDVGTVLQAISQNEGRQVTWEELNPQQRERIYELIRQRKGGQ